MNWKTATVLALIVILLFAAWSIFNQRKWIAKDVEMQVQIAELLQEADEASVQATEAGKRADEAEDRMREALERKAALEAELEGLRGKVRKRLVVTPGSCPGQLEDCDRLVEKLDQTLVLADQAIFACDDALGSCRAQVASLGTEIEKMRQAEKLQAERVETWQQQTRKGRVKTAFLAIGSAAAGGLIGYGAAAAASR